MQRRRFLAVAGTGATVGVAGCGDQGPAIGGDESDDEENESADNASDNETSDSAVASNETEETDANTDESGEESDGGDNETTGEDGAGEDENADDQSGNDGSEDDDGEGDDGETGSDETGDDENETDEGEGDQGDGDDGDEANGDEDEEETYTLAVTVTDATMEDVALEATVEVDGEVRSTTDGEVEYELPNGTYDVTAEPSSEAYQTGTETVAIDGDDAELRIGLVPTSADLAITTHSLREVEGVTDEGNGYVAQGTVANEGTADSEEVYVEVALYNGGGERVDEGLSSSFTVAAGDEHEFGFVAMHEYQSAYNSVDLERYDVRVLTFEGNHVLATAEVGNGGSSAFLSTVRTLLS